MAGNTRFRESAKMPAKGESLTCLGERWEEESASTRPALTQMGYFHHAIGAFWRQGYGHCPRAMRFLNIRPEVHVNCRHNEENQKKQQNHLKKNTQGVDDFENNDTNRRTS